MNEEPQSLQIKIVFKVEHSPDSPEHLHEVLRNTLKAKGLELINNEIYI